MIKLTRLLPLPSGKNADRQEEMALQSNSPRFSPNCEQNRLNLTFEPRSTETMNDDKIHFSDHSSEYKKYIQNGKAVIPDGVTEIISNAFRGCGDLISIETPDSVTELG